MRRRDKRKKRVVQVVVLAAVIIFTLLTVEKTGRFLYREYQKYLSAQQMEAIMQAISELPAEEKENLAEKYYYSLLSEEEKTIYEEIAAGLKEEKEKITVRGQRAERVNEIYQMVLMDYPEFFWCDGSCETVSYEGENGYSVLSPTYTSAGEERKMRKQQIETAVQECLNIIGIDGSEYERIKRVYEYIINTTEYELEAPDNQNIYSVLVNKRSVCAGYARTMQYLLEKMGIYSIYVIGTASGQEAHAWNIVQCDGAFYHVDTTWGDPVFLKQEQREDAKTISYDYLCCPDSELSVTHTVSADYTYPACDSMDKEYYKLNNMYYETADRDQIRSALKEAIDCQQESVDFKFANVSAYEQGYAIIFDDLLEEMAQYLGRKYGLDMVNYGYMKQEETNHITIYWEYQ